MSSDHFYERLPLVPDFAGLCDPSVYAPLPDDWVIAVTDVKDSTGIILRGGYKEVNLIGASSIIALRNLRRSVSLPFIFGGDGAAVALPPSLLGPAAAALRAVQEMARETFGIELRAGIVPVSLVRERGLDLRVARLRLSDTAAQAAFSGGGLAFAEECLRDPALAERCAVGPHVKPEADFTGLECRWKNVPSVHGETVSLIVQAAAPGEPERFRVYREVIAAVERIYGSDAQSHPVQERSLSMSLSERFLYGESGVISWSKGRLYRLRYWFRVRWSVLLGMLLMMAGVRTRATDWGGYRKRVAANTDVKKFDDKVRQVLSGTPEQRRRLTEHLDGLERRGELLYGIHAAEGALVTCLIFDYQDAHVHLVDAENGGYAVAAQRLKEKTRG